MYRIRQHTAYRTRVSFPGLRNKTALCNRIRTILSGEEDFAGVEVRPVTGSVIIQHPKKAVPVSRIIGLVRSTLADAGGKDTGRACAPCMGKSTHVSGTMLILSGCYLLYLGLKKIFQPVLTPVSLVGKVFSLPYLTAFFLSIPVLRHTLSNFRRTGKPDMGLISLMLLYAALFLGNILSALFILWLFNLSSWLETRIQSSTRRAIRDMLAGNISKAWLLDEQGLEREVPAETLQTGDAISLHSGFAVPVDGKIISGRVIVNEARLTGEELPVLKLSGEIVYAGTIIQDGTARVTVTGVGEQTRLAAILRLIEQAERDTSPVERTSNRISQKMVPFALGLSLTAFLVSGSPLMAITVLNRHLSVRFETLHLGHGQFSPEQCRRQRYFYKRRLLCRIERERECTGA